MNADSFDPAQHDAQLVAAFERRDVAQAARNKLLGAGLPAHALEIIPAEAAEPVPGEGFWPSLRRLFAPDEDTAELGEAVGRGDVMVVVRPATPAERETAIEVLKGSGPIDLDARDRAPERPRAAAEQAPEDSTPAAEKRLRVGWRDPSMNPGRVRSYLAAREPASDRVQLDGQTAPDNDRLGA